jgi:hypothetical protein
MAKSTTIAEQLKRHGSQGATIVQCVACHGDIPAYAGRPVSLYSKRYAHHPGQCRDGEERSATVREMAGQGALFAWECRHVEPAGDLPLVCDERGTDRAEYEQHMRSHGATALKVPAPVKLRRTAPAAKLPKLDFSPFKFIIWTEHMHDGTEVTRRGQFWSLTEAPHGVWAITLDKQELVELYRDGDGNWSRNWSDAAASRREANRRAKRQRERSAA